MEEDSRLSVASAWRRVSGWHEVPRERTARARVRARRRAAATLLHRLGQLSLVVLWVWVVPRAASAAEAHGGECGGMHACHCGDRVVADYTLPEDLGPCPHGGLRISRPVVLDGNGHLLRGSGARGSFGVQIGASGSGAHVRNLAVTGFERGFHLAKTELVHLEKVAAHDNGDRAARVGYGIDLATGSSRNVLERVQVFGNADEGIHVGSGAHENRIVDSEVYDNSRENVYFLRNHGNVLARSRLVSRDPRSASVYIKHAARTLLEGNRIEGAPIHLRGATRDTQLIDNVLSDADVVLQRYTDKDPKLGTGAPATTLLRGGRISAAAVCVRVEGATATTIDKVELACPQQLSLEGGGSVLAVATRVGAVHCAGEGRLERARHVDVRLVDAAGKPVAGAPFRAGEGREAIGFSNAQGKYSGLVVESALVCPGGKEEQAPTVLIGDRGRARSVPLAELHGDVRF
jgi:hypothetical protein